MRRLMAVLLVGGVVIVASAFAQGQTIPDHDPHTLIIKFAPHVDGKAVAREVVGQKGTAYVPFPELVTVGVKRLRPLFPVPPKGCKRPDLYDSLGMGQFYVLTLDSSRNARATKMLLESVLEIEGAELNYVQRGVGGEFLPDDPLYSAQWHYPKISLPSAWDITRGSPSILVGVLDTGIDFFHPDLDERVIWNLSEAYGVVGFDDDGNGYIDDIVGWDFVNGDGSAFDDHHHGTHVAGTIGAETGNAYGVAGVDWNCWLLACKVLDENNLGYTTSFISGVYYATNMGCSIINMSLGGPAYNSALEVAINYAYTSGVAVIVAMGNYNTDVPMYPAAYPNVFAVGAVDSLDRRWVDSDTSGSNYGGHIDVVAPGEWIASTYPTAHVTGGYGYSTGTSMAAPHVAGLAALIRSVRPAVWIDSLYWYIALGAEDQVGNPVEDTPGRDMYYGWGRINARRSLALALGCVCRCHADPWCDGVTNVLDVVQTVSVAFRGAPPVFDDDCTYERTDVDCTGFTNVLDVVRIVDVASRGGLPEVNFCDPCVD